MSVFRKLWRGEYSLPLAFWGFYCVGWFPAYLVAGFILAASHLILHLRPLGLIAGIALLSAYWLVVTVGVWQSAGPYWASPIWMSKIWGAGARIVVLLMAAKWILRMADGGAEALLLRMTGRGEF
jgi:hypothetical protein